MKRGSIFTEHIDYADSAQTCIDGADGAIVVTEWNELPRINSPNYLLIS